MLRYLAGIAGILLLGTASLSQAQSYAQTSTPIKAAVVLLDSAHTSSGQPFNYTPFVWYNLDSDTTVKPPGWNIYNPAATTMVTPAVWNRWNNINGDVFGNGKPMPQINDRTSKSTAAYWEIRLSQLSDTQLSNYDALLLSAYGFTNLSTVERDRLRKFVDQGGVLWIDVSSQTNFTNPGPDVTVNTLPLPFATNLTGGPTPLTNADAFSPLTTSPYTLSLGNLEQMRVDRTSYAQPLSQGGATGWIIESWLVTDYFMHFDTVATGAAGPTVLVGKLGAGYIVVTTSGYAAALNRVPSGPSTYQANNWFYALAPTYDRTTQLSAKLAINILSLGGGYAQPGGSARKPNSNLIDLQPPLLNVNDIADQSILPNQAPVLYKGLLVVSSGNQVKVYDAHPKTDLDGDGNPDDGLVDYSMGQTYDELWESAPVAGKLSGPTCAEVPGDPNVRDQIFVVDEFGKLYAFDAFNLNNGTIQGSKTVTPYYTIQSPLGNGNSQANTATTAAPGPYAPTFHDGLLYMSDVQKSPVTGVVWVADPVAKAVFTTISSGYSWYVGANGLLPTLPEPTGSPTIGYIPIQDNSGGYDRVMYLPGRPTSVTGPTGTASITSLWLGTRGESPTSFHSDPGFLQVTTRAASQGLKVYTDAGVSFGDYGHRALGIKITLLDANGDPFSNQRMSQTLAGTVTLDGLNLDFPFAAGAVSLPVGTTVRIDYSVDWGAAPGMGSMTTQIIRGQLYLPDDYTVPSADDRRHILGNIAMSPRGTIYCVTSTGYSKPDAGNNTKDCGSFYAIREDIGRGGFRLLTRFQLFPRHSIPLNQASPVSYEQNFEDNDTVLTSMAPSFLAGKDFSHLTFVGTPSVRDNVVYCTVLGRKPGAITQFVPFGLLLAFKAEPEPPEIKVGDIPDGFTLRQYDIDRSSNHAAPLATNDMSQGQFTYDRAEGIVRFDNLMTSNRGVMVNSFSTSQPVVLRQPNAPDLLLEPDLNGNHWSPLLWYSVLHGVQPTGGAFTSGASVFLPGSSVIPNLSNSILNQKLVFSGMVEAINGRVAPDDPFLFANADGTRPWLKQLVSLLATGSLSSPINSNPHFLWPQLAGIRDFSDYQIRAAQTRLGAPTSNSGSTTCYGILGGEGSLAAWGDHGVYTFSKADFIVADEGRLGRFDAAGNPLWIASTSSTTGAIDDGAVGGIKGLVRPIRAYPIGTSDIVIVDPGANRVARLDLSGREIRSITGFSLDPAAPVPDGYKANEPMTLNSPRDVAYFTTFEVVNGFTQMWNHYLVADAGNKRLLEIVDKYSVNASRQVTGTVAVGVLNWHSPTNFSNKDFEYNSIARVFLPNGAGGGRFLYLAGIGGALPSRVDTGLDSPTGGVTQPRESVSGNGGIVIFDPLNPAQNALINQVQVPEIFKDTYWDFQTQTYNSPDRPAHSKSLTNIESVTAKVVYDPVNQIGRVAIMFTDATGVYEIWLQDGTLNDYINSPWQVRWMLPREAYQSIRKQALQVPSPFNAMDLRATYARRLDDGSVLVVNGYYGKTRGGVNPFVPQADFLGEVLQISGDFDADPTHEGFGFNKANLGFDLGMIVFQLPPIQGARGLVIPVFADRR